MVGLTGIQQSAIIADRATGMSQKDIAAKYGKHPVTISRLLTRLTRATPRPEIVQRSISELKSSMIQPAARAIHRGLACEDDVYKAANLGVNVLKGVGVFTETQQTSVQAMIMATPAVFRDAFLEASALPELAIAPQQLVVGPDDAEPKLISAVESTEES